MKKFVIGAVILILAFVAADYAYYNWGWYIKLPGGSGKIESFTSVEGREILVDTGNGLEPFEIRGVDMGVGIPGHFATEYAIDKDTYLRWFEMIQEMGANTVRVYTIQSSDFYEAVYEYNCDNPEPLYFLHGVWVNDYVQNSRVDAYNKSFLKEFKKDCTTLVDVIHGNRRVNLGYGTSNSSGSYSVDVSQWVLGYILGVEWEDVTVAFTDHMEKQKNVYEGMYMYTGEDATPFEAMLAQVGDTMIQYETDRYGKQRLIAFSNWPTTDPLEYPEEVAAYFLKCAQVDVEHIKSTGKFLSGQFASYHVYPYYPNYYAFFEEWKNMLVDLEPFLMENGEYNLYKAYLATLARHHSMPVIISEFGVPTSRGMAQNDSYTGRAQGYMSEQEQGEAIVDSYEDIMEAGCAGCVIFTWQDEWFKRTWNTMANVSLQDTAYWSDYQTNEQYFGLLSFDPGKERSVCYTDGDMEEWSDADLLIDDDCKLYMKYDEKYVYFRIHKNNLNFGQEKIYIPIDTTQKTGSNYVENEAVRTERESDFLIVLDGKENSRVLVQQRYNPYYMIQPQTDTRNMKFDPPEKNTPIFEPVYLILQFGDNILLKELLHDDLTEKYETGKLLYGNGNPGSPDFNSKSDFIVNGDDIEIRLPWQLLNFMNPSEMEIHGDYYEDYGIEAQKIKGMYLGITDESHKEERVSMNWMPLKGWGKNPTYHERLKESYYRIQEVWSKQ